MMNVLTKPKKPLYQEMGKDVPNVMEGIKGNDIPNVLIKPKKALINETNLK